VADDDFQQRPTYMFGRVSSALRHQVDGVLREFSLTTTQLGALSHLKLARPAALSGAEIARRTGVTPQSMSTALAGLMERGLVEREPHPTHGRILQVRITPAGTALRDRAQAAVTRINDRILAELSESQQAQLREILGRLMDALELRVPKLPSGDL
jgi:DNA-binding MarR family transcriptional regulator